MRIRSSLTMVVLASLAAGQAASAPPDKGYGWQTYLTVVLEADGFEGSVCEHPPSISLNPVTVRDGEPRTLYSHDAIVAQTLKVGRPIEDGPKNFECWFEYHSPLLAPGVWKVTGEFASGSKSCNKSVEPHSENVLHIDEEEGCIANQGVKP
ncbi:MAG: hypothetical protein R3E77_15500 [Steroidobacteraceae bacterium]